MGRRRASLRLMQSSWTPGNCVILTASPGDGRIGPARESDPRATGDAHGRPAFPDGSDGGTATIKSASLTFDDLLDGVKALTSLSAGTDPRV